MKLDKLVGERFKEKPSDCVIESHALMMRGGYMKDVAKGIYSQFTPLKRSARKSKVSSGRKWMPLTDRKFFSL